ncbi:bactofilin family protein [Citrobacter meridianamericanus]|uniref:Polymer-forming cytoskeletal protein n=1 Tax=Citrobacter meridianamericanus TaxID=2894201 RepID=A0ABT1BFE3_9ENTR|nr:polymer-forming cytoskeletal protein [Citrobacter meridianamericanus]MCO5784607.1 polymer-forming cytoskeletal protein [Citrobacter meridianamericanus]
MLPDSFIRHAALCCAMGLWLAGLVLSCTRYWSEGVALAVAGILLCFVLIMLHCERGENMFRRRTSVDVSPAGESVSGDDTDTPRVPAGTPAPVTTRRCTLLAEGTHVTGDLVVTGDCQVCGHISGTVTLSDGVLRVMKGGRIDGDVRAPSVTIDGSIQGTCDAEQVEILENGNLDGICRSRQFSIASGGVFTGQSERRAEPALTDKDTEEGLSGTVTDLPSHRAWLTPLASVTDTESGGRADG